MRWWLTAIGASGFLVLVFFLTREGRSQADEWMSIVGGLAGVASTAVLLGQLVVQSRGRPQRQARRELLRRCALHLSKGDLPLVRDVRPAQLGVKAAIGSAGPAARSVLPYLPREADQELEWLVADGGVVLVHGRAAAGKTRTAYEAIHRLRPEHGLLVPESGGALRELADSGEELRNVVVWLDDLERYLTPRGLDRGVLERLCPPGRSDVVVLATMRGEELDRLHRRPAAPDGTPTAEQFWTGVGVLERIPEDRRVRIDQYLRPAEQQTARRSRDDRIVAAAGADVGFAEYLAAGPQLMQRWTAESNRRAEVGQALISAAVDCRRAGWSAPIPEDVLTAVFRNYLTPALRARGDLPPAVDGLAWASEPLLGASSCLWPLSGDGYQVADYLVDRTDHGEGRLAETAITRILWDTLLGRAGPEARFLIGTAAYTRGEHDVAEAAMRPLADAGDPLAMFNLAVLLSRRTAWEEATRWYRRAADAGYVAAMVNLAVTLRESGEDVEAAQWYRRAAGHGHAAAMMNLGVLRKIGGDHAGAAYWYRQAAAAGDIDAMYNLGLLMEEREEPDYARVWYQRAAGQGHPLAAEQLQELAATDSEVKAGSVEPTAETLTFDDHGVPASAQIEPGPAWRQCRDYLITDSGVPHATVSALQEQVTDLVRRMQPSEQSRSFRGLVVGHVGAGMSAWLVATIAAALDRGYRLLIVLTGPLKAQEHQTRHWIERVLGGPYASGSVQILVVKKNATVLRRLLADIDSEGMSGWPALVIDDIRDEATISAMPRENWERTARVEGPIAGLMHRLLTQLPQAAYVAFSKTLFTNALVDPARPTDLFPRDLVMCLPAPDGYVGPEILRDLDPESLVSADPPMLSEQPAHVRLFNDDDQDESLRAALDLWVLTGAVRRFRARSESGPAGDHVLLVHGPRRIDERRLFAERIEALWSETHGDWEQRLQHRYETDILPVSRSIAPELPLPADFEDLQADLIAVVRAIGERPVHTSWDDPRAAAQTSGYSVMVLSGASRTPVLRGTVITHAWHTSATLDRLSQAGQSLGFRAAYRDLIRFVTTPALHRSFLAAFRAESAARHGVATFGPLPPIMLPPVLVALRPDVRVRREDRDWNAYLIESRSPGRPIEPVAYPVDGEAIRSNLQGWEPVLRTPRTRQQLRTGTGDREFSALVGVVDHRTLMSVLSGLTWLVEDCFRPHLTWLRSLTERQIARWVIVFPENSRPGSARAILGAGPFSISVRQRTERGPFRVLSSPLHRAAARRIAGLFSPVADEVAARLSGPATGCLVVYAVAENPPAGVAGDPADERSTTLAFHLVTPMSTAPADGALTAWGVRSPDDPSAVTTDSAPKSR
ncbi:Z1 domain-containing protein [Actinoplanes sp. NPDC024001]|uniref:Z1 domain-containing protein n=1 Tax=Actinoplanes sp. NPDC024001 TaxID=3154598 RepID=UPI0033F6A632